ncbi:MAG: hypothetical protein GY932_14265, partial [Arcobacter sp.]|nr:hypothetical protein [Arcobacter sp.]
GLKKSIQKGVSPDAYYGIEKKNSENHQTYIKSDYLIFSEINGEELVDGAGLALGLGPRKINLKPGIHTFKVFTGLSTLTFKKINIKENRQYFFGYNGDTFWLKDLTENKVVYGYEPINN